MLANIWSLVFTLKCWALNKGVAHTIFKVFRMTTQSDPPNLYTTECFFKELEQKFDEVEKLPNIELTKYIVAVDVSNAKVGKTKKTNEQKKNTTLSDILEKAKDMK